MDLEASTATPGVSVLICCHNSSRRLPATLSHLVTQEVPEDVSWEVVIVDNGSTDGTSQVALQSWPEDAPAPLRVVSEPRLGLSHARHRGFLAAEFEFVSFIDDDNWVDRDWVQVIAEVMSVHPEIGACGSYSKATSKTSLPWWFERYQMQYAVGPQAEEAGDITWTRGWLWGAGLVIRKSAWQGLVKNGFQSLLSGRTGNRLTAGEDLELCLAMRLAGWRLYYEPRLRLRHSLPAHRLQWAYLRRLNRGFGAASVGHDPYYFAQFTTPDRLKGRSGRIWTWQARATLERLLRYRGKLLQLCHSQLEGDPEVVEIERLVGRLSELLRKRRAYDRSIQAVWSARWRQV